MFILTVTNQHSFVFHFFPISILSKLRTLRKESSTFFLLNTVVFIHSFISAMIMSIKVNKEKHFSLHFFSGHYFYLFHVIVSTENNFDV